MNCKEARESILAGDVGGRGLRDHISRCGECAKLSAQEDKLTAMLRSVPEVGLPDDFDRSLRQKIESRTGSGDRNAFLRPALVVPVVAVAILAAFSVVLTGFLTDFRSPPITETRPATRSTTVGGPEPSPSRTPEVVEQRESQSVPAVQPTEELVSGSVPAVPSPERDERKGSEGGSLDQAARREKTIVPPWARPTDLPSPKTSAARKFSAGEVLKEFGIIARYTGNGWQVRSVKKGSAGEKTGILRGDLIRALDGRILDDQPLEGPAVSGKQFLLVRNGSEMTLSIRP